MRDSRRSIAWYAQEGLTIAVLTAFCWAVITFADRFQGGAFP